MISIRNVTKHYPMRGGGLHYVLKDVSFDIPSNESIAIIGPNGAGKSTLLRLIGGAEAPDQGTITTESTISWPIGIKSGFQGSMTGRQNIHFACQINGLSKAEILEVSDAVFEFSELGEFYDMPVKSYSSGMRARLGFGLSVNFDFDYYLIDELTSVGDIIFKRKAKKEFKRIAEASSLIYVSHSLSSLRSACKSAIFLHDGTLQYYDDIKDGIKAYKSYIKQQTGIPPKDKSKPSAKKRAPKKVPKKIARKATRKATRKVTKKAAKKVIRRAIKRATKRAAEREPSKNSSPPIKDNEL